MYDGMGQLARIVDVAALSGASSSTAHLLWETRLHRTQSLTQTTEAEK